MKFGGMMSHSKYELLGKLPECYIPKSILVKQNSLTEDLINNEIKFPVIAKPNEGERGWGVERIETALQLQEYFANAKEDVLIQDFIDFDLELSILYYRYPLIARGHISSIALKGFRTVLGNGKDTLSALIRDKYPKMKVSDYPLYLIDKVNLIIPENETVQVNCIGNIARGAHCVNYNHIIEANIIEVFDRITSFLPDFYYGRFDLKVPSVNHLRKGIDIKIMELNGTGCQPMHVFDENVSWWERYKAFYRHFKTIYRIGRINHSRGVKYSGLYEFIKDYLSHWRMKLA
jgi:hypothetical protein